MDSAFDKLLPEIRLPHSAEHLRGSLAEADILGGRVWMVDVPLRGDSRAAATVLVALSPPDEEEALKRTLFGPTLLMAELIAHKGYSMMRDYRGEPQQNYKKKLKDFWNTSDKLLAGLGGPTQKPIKLDEAVRWNSSLTNVVSKFNRMYVSMAQQLHNYERWRVQTEGNGIVEYHYDHLETGHRELELLVAEGKDALGVADKALSMARVELDKAQESNQRIISLLLTVTGVALAGPRLLNELGLGGNWWAKGPVIAIIATAILALMIIASVRLVGRLQDSRLLACGSAYVRTAVRAVLEGWRNGVR